MKTYHKFYQILDVSLSLISDSQEFLTLFNRDYGWFETAQSNGGQELSILVRLHGNGKDLLVRIHEFSFTFEDHPAPACLAYQRVLAAIFEEVRDFMVLHAGVVAEDDRAFALAGPPGIGKSTLVVELLEKGFTLLSDDFCPIHLKTGLVYPFPRSLWISPNSGELDHLHAGPRENISIRANKTFVPPAELACPVAVQPSQLHCIVCLTTVSKSDLYIQLEIELKIGEEDDFLSELRQLGGVAVSRVSPQAPYWRIQYPCKERITGTIRALLKKHKQNIWNVHQIECGSPDFNQEPQLTPISKHEAAFHLMRNLKQQIPSDVETTGALCSPSGLFIKLNELLQKTSCYTLSVGYLQTTRDLLIDLWNRMPDSQ